MKKKKNSCQVNESAFLLMAGALAFMSVAYDKIKEELEEVKREQNGC